MSFCRFTLAMLNKLLLRSGWDKQIGLVRKQKALTNQATETRWSLAVSVQNVVRQRLGAVKMVTMSRVLSQLYKCQSPKEREPVCSLKLERV